MTTIRKENHNYYSKEDKTNKQTNDFLQKFISYETSKNIVNIKDIL
jgi:hypothetical protein